MKFCMYYDIPSDLSRDEALQGSRYFKECYLQYETKTAELVAEAALSNYTLIQYLLSVEYRAKSELKLRNRVIQINQDGRFEGNIIARRDGNSVPLLPPHYEDVLDEDLSMSDIEADAEASIRSDNPHQEGLSDDVSDYNLKELFFEAYPDFASEPYPVDRFRTVVSILARDHYLDCDTLVFLHTMYNTGSFRTRDHTEITYLRSQDEQFPGGIHIRQQNIFRQICICTTRLIRLWHTLNLDLVSTLFFGYTSLKFCYLQLEPHHVNISANAFDNG